MSEAVELWERPKASEMYLLAGWRQWADAGSVSSGLPRYLIQRTKARPIGIIRSQGFYLFQIPGTHDLVRPVVRFRQGYPESLTTQKNEIYFVEHEGIGLIIFEGDEPHIDVDRYASAFLEVAYTLKARRMVGFGGVYGEVPYDRERLISAIYSQPHMKDEMKNLGVNLSDYQGGASIGSVICRKAAEQGAEYVAFYAFVPAYDFSNVAKISNTIRIENDYMAWMNVLQRVNYMLKTGFDLSDLERRSRQLIKIFDKQIEELEGADPQIGIRDYLNRLSEEFVEIPFTPLDDVWEQEIRRLFGKIDPGEDQSTAD